MNKVLIVIPAYNEEANIENVVRELEDKYPQFDYIVVNDGSRDRTAAICRENGFNLLDLPVNLGLAGCFQAGMKYAYHKGYEYAIQFDGDGQHRPEFIEPMMEKMKEGYEIVIGSRFVNAKKMCIRDSPGRRRSGEIHRQHQPDRCSGSFLQLQAGRVPDRIQVDRPADLKRGAHRCWSLYVRYGRELRLPDRHLCP